MTDVNLYIRLSSSESDIISTHSTQEFAYCFPFWDTIFSQVLQVLFKVPQTPSLSYSAWSLMHPVESAVWLLRLLSSNTRPASSFIQELPYGKSLYYISIRAKMSASAECLEAKSEMSAHRYGQSREDHSGRSRVLVLHWELSAGFYFTLRKVSERCRLFHFHSVVQALIFVPRHVWNAKKLMWKVQEFGYKYMETNHHQWMTRRSATDLFWTLIGRQKQERERRF